MLYPSGSDPQWIYVTNTGSVVRYPYRSGDLKARGKAEVIVRDLSHAGGRSVQRGHITRDIVFSKTTARCSSLSDRHRMTGRGWANAMPPRSRVGKRSMVWGAPGATRPIARPSLCSTRRAGIGECSQAGCETAWGSPSTQRLAIFGARTTSATISAMISSPTSLRVCETAQAGSASGGEYEDFMTGFVVNDSSVWARLVGHEFRALLLESVGDVLEENEAEDECQHRC
jgi:hypothetical protein